jgi:naphtho-gamma-pyrone polyketide synthase
MALTIGEYLVKSSAVHDESTGVDVADMKVGKALTQSGNGPQLLRVSATANWAKQTAHMTFFSVNAEGKKTSDHAICTVRFGDRNDWAKDWKRNTYLIKSRIDALHRGVNDGQSHKVKRGMAYKLFGAVVEYGKAYQGMQEVVLDSDMLEATAQVKFQATEKDGNFNFGPYRIDSLGHIAGFIMNANDNNDSKATVFVNHGWDRMRCVAPFDSEKTYQTYNKMQNIGGTLFSGDTYILEGGNIVAVFEGIKVSCNNPTSGGES